MKPTKIAHTLSAALALQTTAGVAAHVEVKTPAAATDALTSFTPAGGSASTSDLIEAQPTITLSDIDNVFSVKMYRNAEWDEDAIRRYRKLAVKEATSKLTTSEVKELQSLEELRFRVENTLSGEELVAQYRREKTGIEMLQLLQKYVRVAPNG